MSKLTFVIKMAVFGVCVVDLLSADSSLAYQLPSSTWHQGSSAPATTPAKEKPPAPVPHKEPATTSPFTPKQTLPPMTKPFGMPGVIGIQHGKWAGTDYLGYLSANIGVDVEILKGENTPVLPDAATLTSRAGAILSKENLTPQAEVTEGPPLPFLHILLIVYPVDKDKFVVFGTCRLFEQIQVMRKNFSPAGFWQGITWENQDINLTTTEQLDAQIKSTVDKLVTAFVERYRIYNPSLEPAAEVGTETGTGK